MGTETKNLQNQIKEELNRVGWTQKRLGREVYVATYEYDNDDELQRYEERIKKDLQRPTTAPKRLEEYLRLIQQHGEYRNLCRIAPVYLGTDDLSESLVKSMKDISREISQKIEAREKEG